MNQNPNNEITIATLSTKTPRLKQMIFLSKKSKSIQEKTTTEASLRKTEYIN